MPHSVVTSAKWSSVSLADRQVMAVSASIEPAMVRAKTA
jgi:hypothetical protein